jgi:2-iminobutanoate/2-iminopropanoate deaminase
VNKHIIVALVATTLIVQGQAYGQQQGTPMATPLEYIHADGQFKGPVPISPAVKVGKFVYVSGTPAFDNSGKIAVGEFPVQMKQVMENITGTLKAAGTDWSRVAKVNVILTRQTDVPEMNRVYAGYFPSGNYPARTTMIVAALPQASFLLEIECEAVLE